MFLPKTDDTNYTDKSRPASRMENQAVPNLAENPTSVRLDHLSHGLSHGVSHGVKSKRGNGVREWRTLWRERNDHWSTSEPIKGKGGEHLEDRDGSFVCWCCCKAPGNKSGPASGQALVISGYGVPRDSYSMPRDRASPRGNRRSPSEQAATLSCGGMPQPSDATGPGLSILEEASGKRIGGLLGGGLMGTTAPAPADRYLIHGIVAGPDFVALYDSNLCLHVASLPTAPVGGQSCQSQALPAVSRAESLLAGLASKHGGSGEARKKSAPGRGEAGGEGEARDSAEPRRTCAKTSTTLVNNDHGLVAAQLWQVRGEGGGAAHDTANDAADDYATPELSDDGVEVSITRRDPLTGSETVVQSGKPGSPDAGVPLAFLPSYAGGDGILAADMKWGRVALFTTYVTLVYTLPDGGTSTSGGKPIRKHQDGQGGWRAYMGGRHIDGLLMGGEQEPRGFPTLLFPWS